MALGEVNYKNYNNPENRTIEYSIVSITVNITLSGLDKIAYRRLYRDLDIAGIVKLLSGVLLELYRV
jgi:hypothetical protein